jgi:hypothetical protein
MAIDGVGTNRMQRFSLFLEKKKAKGRRGEAEKFFLRPFQ